MKKYLIIGLCIFGSSQPMDNSKTDLQQHLENNQKTNNIESEFFLYFLEKNKLETHNKSILNIGCGCNKISVALAEKASAVHALDANKKAIEFTQKQYPHIKNLFFEHCSFPEFPLSSKYDVALAFYMSDFKNKERLLLDINKILKMNGEFFGAIFTKENPAPKNHIAALEMLPSILKIMPDLTPEQYLDFVSYQSPCQQEVNDLLKLCGFEIILNQEQSHEIAITLNDLITQQLFILYSRPIYTYIPAEHRLALIKQYIKCYTDKLSRDENEKYLQPMVMNIIHARKIKEVKMIRIFIKNNS